MNFQSELTSRLKSNGKKIAIEKKGRNISYNELLSTADKVTSYLQEHGVEAQSRIGILLSDKIDMISTMIGIMNARCVFVPVDVSQPKERLKSMSDDLQLTHFISSGAHNEVDTYFTGTKIGYSTITDISEAKVNYPDYDGDDSLYIYFTSGSTGRPKGIIGRNKSLLQFVNWEISTFSIDNTSRFSQFISSYFDAFLRDVFVPLMAGGTICITPEDVDFLSTEKLIDWIDSENISMIHCVPSLFRVFNDGSLTTDHFQNLKDVLLSGEKIVPSELKNWYRIFGDRIKLVNLYGTTETTMIRSFYEIKPEDANQHKISIGSPIGDTELMIANKDFIKCNPLIPGDLYIISRYVTKGYLNDQSLTDKKFITLHEGTPEETIAFRTGDKARIMADGKIDLLGREDRQVKLSGIRVELDEIETVLVQSGMVKQASVVIDAKENDALIAFVILNENKQETELEKEAGLKLGVKLPKYMIPSRIIAVSEFPLLSNGKINYKELLSFKTKVEMVPPANDIESRILDIWKSILGDKPISTEESFHSIGGNSLSIMKLIGLLYKEYKVRIALSDIFANLTIKSQAALIQNAKKDDVLEINRTEVREGYHLSASQERIYYNYEVNKNSTTYNIPVAWEITGEVNKVKIESAIKKVIERHESLRTSFRFVNDELLQVVNDEFDFTLEEQRYDGDDIEGAIKSAIQPFDLQKSPLFRATVVTNSDARKLLVMDVHHIVCDGISQQQIYTDFMKAYQGNYMEALDIQFKDYAEWEHEFKSKQEYLAYREFWLKSFEGKIPKLELPVTKRATDSTDKGGNYTFPIDRSKIEPIMDTLKQDEVTVFSGLFSVYFLYLSQLTGQDDIVVGTVSSGRLQQELDNVVGMFSKSLPIRRLIEPNISFIEFAKGLHKYLVEANSKQAYDLTNIVSEMNAIKPSHITDLFEVMFVFQNFEHSEGKDGFSYINFDNSNAKYPISLYASEGTDTYDFRFEYFGNYFTKADIEVVATQFESLVEKIAENPEAKVIDIIGGTGATTTSVEEDDIAFNF